MRRSECLEEGDADDSDDSSSVRFVVLLDTQLFYNDREHETKSLAVALYNMEKVTLLFRIVTRL